MPITIPSSLSYVLLKNTLAGWMLGMHLWLLTYKPLAVSYHTHTKKNNSKTPLH